MNYYNENDPFCCDWIRSLIRSGFITDGEVDDRSISEVQSDDVAGFRRVHFFSGLGGWDHALNLAGWGEREVWTGSAPCQPFSAAGKGLGEKDERHLWPEFFRLIRECRPPVVFGEQVSSSQIVGDRLEASLMQAIHDRDQRTLEKVVERLGELSDEEIDVRWLDGISADLEGEGYAVGPVVLGAHSVGAPHIRQRLFWVADTTGMYGPEHERESRYSTRGQTTTQDAPECRGAVDGLADAQCDGRGLNEQEQGPEGRTTDRRIDSRVDGLGDTNGQGSQPGDEATEADGHGSAVVATGGGIGGLGDAERDRLRSGGRPQTVVTEQPSDWSLFHVVQCRDGKARRISAQPMLQPLASGVPRKMAPLVARLAQLGVDSTTAKAIIRAARRNRVGCLRGAGNAIVPQVAAAFIAAYMETQGIKRKE